MQIYLSLSGLADCTSLLVGRLTAQWSVEDEEEAARERRRRERERQLRSQAEDGLATTGSSSESGMPVQENQCDVKPAGTLELEEDEGFSDWSQKLEQRKQRSAEEAAQDGEQPCHRGWRETQEAAPIIERTESLNRSIKKSNSVKKSQPPLPVAKIDDKLEQYTHAIESSSKTPKPVRQPSIDLSTTTMAVASTKNLWETGEVAAQSSAKSTPCKVSG
uniref:Lymphocyte specific protein 1 n=1 Tax=Sphenodon punctatus TaxID=8508 RepID=A0A8D0G9L0_SPHPU